MNTTTKTVTKKAKYAALLNVLAFAEEQNYVLPEDTDYGMLSDFLNHEVELLENKASASAKRAQERKVAGDQLRDKIYGLLSDVELKTINDIVVALAEQGETDVSANMVIARLTQLFNLDRIDKESITIQATTEGGKNRKVYAYRRKV